jgi:hypothetical protein
VNATHDPGWYEIRIQGRLDERWAAWFDGMSVEPEPNAITVLRGAVADQTALHGLLARLRDLGIPLISVISADPGADHDAASGRPDQ